MPAAGAKEQDELTTIVRTESTDAGKIDETTPGGIGVLAVCPTSAAPEILTSGVPSTAGNDTSATDCHYKINVPAPAGLRLRAVVSWVGLSDHDVYVKQGTAATVSPYYCSEVGVSQVSPSQCAGAATLVAGDYWIRVKRWNGATDFVLTVFIETPPPTCSLGTGTTPLTDNVAMVASLTADAGAACRFMFTPSPIQDTVQVTLNPSPSDFDLYVKKGSAPTTTSYDCRPYLGGAATETCSLSNDGSDVYIMVLRFSGSGSFSVTARAFSACSYGNIDQLLGEDASFSGSLTADAGGACFAKFDALAGFDVASISMTPNAGSNYDLYVKTGSRPTTSSYTCRSILTGAGAAEGCDVAGDAGTVYVMIVRVSGSGSFDVRAKSLSSCSLGPGVHPLSGSVTASLLGSVGANCKFSFAPSTSADFAHFVLNGLASDFDLYVKKGVVPTTSVYDCRPYLGGTAAETCDQLIEDATSFYVMVRRFSGSGAFTILGENIIIPELANGMPVTANAAQGTMTYYKVVIPAVDANGYAPTQLAIATIGDMTGAVCAAVDANVGAGTCIQARNADATACAAAQAANPGTCAGAYAAAADACTQINALNPGTCTGAPDVLVGITNVDLYVRHRVGLPTTSISNCKGTGAGSTETCAFSSEGAQAAADARAAYTQTRTDVWAQVGPNCPDPAVCGVNPLPTFPATSNLVPFMGAGKYFIGVRGTTGPADYAIVAAWV